MNTHTDTYIGGGSINKWSLAAGQRTCSRDREHVLGTCSRDREHVLGVEDMF
jgi:hypothetical protein